MKGTRPTPARASPVRATERAWLAELELEAELAAAVLMSGLTRVQPPASARDRLLGGLAGGRLDRFAGAIAALIDVSLAQAQAALEQAFDPSAWDVTAVPGVSTLWVAGGPAVQGCIRGFVRIDAGAAFPPHRHLGDEDVLVLDGVMVDSDGTRYRSGDRVPHAGGTEHGYAALTGATDLLIFAVVREGIALGDQIVKHADGAGAEGLCADETTSSEPPREL